MSTPSRGSSLRMPALQSPAAIASSPGAAAAILRVPAHLVADTIASEATRIAGAPAALYLIDIDGSCLRQLAGSPDLPRRLDLVRAVGPEIPEEWFAELERAIRSQLLGSTALPMALYGRALAVLVTRRTPQGSLEELAAEGAIALDVASRYTDSFEAARRGRCATAAAEAQHNMLPARIACPNGAHVAGTVLPAYEVGGDWFDHAEDRTGTWLALADAVGKGADSTALSAIALGALRAARRDGATIEEAALAMHHAIYDMEDEAAFVTAVIAHWNPRSSELTSITCGHSPPLLQHGDGRFEELVGASAFPLGIFERDRTFEPSNHRLEAGDRLVIYSDGVTECRTADGGFLGLSGIKRALMPVSPGSPADAVSAIERAVIDASPGPLRDDATLIVLSPKPVTGGKPVRRFVSSG